jgi:GNAT superfamily N-acetyltransferase
MFDLPDELLRQIIFAMENQHSHYLVDTELGVLVKADTLDPEEVPDPEETEIDITRRYQELPRWTSADGFQMMERFLGELHNPVARNTLQEILLSGKRVFRRFKDTIREYPEVEKRYHRYKHLEMRRIVWEWYTGLRDLAGLDTEELGADQELDDLVLTEVTIVTLDKVPTATILEMDEHGFIEAYPDLPAGLRAYLYRNRRRTYALDPADGRSHVYGAYTPVEDLCGALWASRDRTAEGEIVLELLLLYVSPQYRGLGVATSLVHHFLEDQRRRGMSYVVSRLPGKSPPVKALMRHNGFAELRQEYLLIEGEGQGGPDES